MRGRAPIYVSFLLRLYCVQRRGSWEWRALLEDPMSGKQYTFPNVIALCQFLHEYLGKMNEKNGRGSA